MQGKYDDYFIKLNSSVEEMDKYFVQTDLSIKKVQIQVLIYHFLHDAPP